MLDLLGTARDIAIDSDGDLWIAVTTADPFPAPQTGGLVERWAKDGQGGYERVSTIDFGDPWLVSIGPEGQVWVGDRPNETLNRIDPNGGNPIAGSPPGIVDLVVDLGPGGSTNSVGDGTGFGVLSGTSNQGTWTVTFDSEQPNTPWGTGTWGAIVPKGTSVTAKVRAANDPSDLASQPFVTIQNAIPFTGVEGQHIEIQVTLSRDFGVGERPILDFFEIEAAECHMLIAEDTGEDIFRFGDNSHAFQTRLRNIYKSYAVLMEALPTMTLNLPEPEGVVAGASKGGVDGEKPWRTFYVQIVMWNPRVYPGNPEQSTPGMKVQVFADGTVRTSQYGDPDGDMSLALEVRRVSDGLIEMTVPFVVGPR